MSNRDHFAIAPRPVQDLRTVDDLRPVEIVKGLFEPTNFRSRNLLEYVGDISGSMHAYREKVANSWKGMLESLSKRPSDCLGIELAFCAFASRVAFHDFAPPSYYLEAELNLDVGGGTRLGAALRAVMRQTRKRRELLLEAGIECERVICVVVTDGQTADTDVLAHVIPTMRQAEANGEIEFVPLAIDVQSVPVLKKIFGKEPIPVDDVDFDELFGALGRSLSQWSQGSASRTSAIDLIRSEMQKPKRGQLLSPAADPPRLGYHEE